MGLFLHSFKESQKIKHLDDHLGATSPAIVFLRESKVQTQTSKVSFHKAMSFFTLVAPRPPQNSTASFREASLRLLDNLHLF